MTKFVWWFLFVFHNIIAHPLLIPARVAHNVGSIALRLCFENVARTFFFIEDCLHQVHDSSVPEDDSRNVVTMKKKHE